LFSQAIYFILEWIGRIQMFEGASILLTGGTGSLGKEVIAHLLKTTKVRRIAIYSRDELKQMQVRTYFQDDPRLRWFIGDIRDLNRLKRALHGVDYVIHAAALKQVDTGEYNPMEFIKTNVVALSTDKASSPINLYGATKLTADKLFIAANNYSKAYGTSFSVVRYGNVMGSRGSVIPFFQELVKKGEPLPLTDLRMTRFWISIKEAVEFVMGSFELMDGGELYVPRIPSMKLIDLAHAIDENSVIKEIGMRPGEKLHEEMISADDSRRTIVMKDRFVVMPVVAEWGYVPPAGIPMEDGKAYRSDTNDLWMTKNDIQDFIKTISG